MAMCSASLTAEQRFICLASRPAVAGSACRTAVARPRTVPQTPPKPGARRIAAMAGNDGSGCPKIKVPGVELQVKMEICVPCDARGLFRDPPCTLNRRLFEGSDAIRFDHQCLDDSEKWLPPIGRIFSLMEHD